MPILLYNCTHWNRWTPLWPLPIKQDHLEPLIKNQLWKVIFPTRKTLFASFLFDYRQACTYISSQFDRFQDNLTGTNYNQINVFLHWSWHHVFYAILTYLIFPQNVHIFLNVWTFSKFLSEMSHLISSQSNIARPLLIKWLGIHRKCSIQWAIIALFLVSERYLLMVVLWYGDAESAN